VLWVLARTNPLVGGARARRREHCLSPFGEAGLLMKIVCTIRRTKVPARTTDHDDTEGIGESRYL
jgi:hypothetical protein